MLLSNFTYLKILTTYIIPAKTMYRQCYAHFIFIQHNIGQYTIVTDKYTFYITFKMSKRSKVFEKHKLSAEEALNIIISEEFTLGTSSSDDSSSESSYSDDTTNMNSQSPSPKVKKRKKIQKSTIENDMFYEHGKSHVVGVSQTHVQPTSNIPTAPQASKKLDTPATFRDSHDKCQFQHSPDTVTTDAATEELIVSIPIHFEFKNPQNENFGILPNNSLLQEPETVDQNPEEIEFSPEYFCNGQLDPTNSDNDN